MVMNKPPPAYTAGDQASKHAPPAYSAGVAPPSSIPTAQPAQQEAVQPNGCAYWTYWGFLFATPLTWIFAVTAASASWLDSEYGDYRLAEVSACQSDLDDVGEEDLCDKLQTGAAFQYLATILISVVCIIAFVAACMPAPMSEKLGLAAGIMLAVFSVFELITFSVMATFIKDVDDAVHGIAYNTAYYSYYTEISIEPGPAFGVAVVAWLLGMAAAIAVLALRRRVAQGQDGPCRRGAGAAAPPAGPTAQVPAVGTV